MATIKNTDTNFPYEGIDVSKWQGEIDFKKVSENVDFVMIRDGYGTTYTDPYFKRNCDMCDSYMIPYGVYHYFTSTKAEGISKEVDALLDRLTDVRPDWPIVVDMEEKYYRSNPKLSNSFAKLALAKIEAKGYFAMLYTNKDFFDNVWDDEIKKKYAIWYARYANVPYELPKEASINQYSSSGCLPGISGRVDLNMSKVNYSVIIRNKGLNKLDVELPKEEKCRCTCGCCNRDN